ncbi:MAG: dihydrodipicolinate synthase family protein [bacterium]|nr:dihydrodipicolinate synthase family protein [bacterium]
MRTPPNFMPALITPFDEEGDIIVEAHAHNLRVQTSRGVTGFVLGGSTGEGPYFEAGERASLLDLARQELGATPFLVCGVQTQSVRQAEHQVSEIADAGADAALVMTPTSLARGNHEAMRRFFDAVAEASPLPIFLYSVPAVTGYDLPAESVAALAQHPKIIGLKDSGGRPLHTKEVVQSTPDDFMVYTGSSGTLLQGMAAGAVGAITASGNYLPELVSALVSTSRSSVSEAEPIQARLTKATREIETYGVVGTKAAAGAAGLWTGIPRKPLQPVPRTELAKIDQIVKAARESADELVAG